MSVDWLNQLVALIVLNWFQNTNRRHLQKNTSAKYWPIRLHLQLKQDFRQVLERDFRMSEWRQRNKERKSRSLWTVYVIYLSLFSAGEHTQSVSRGYVVFLRIHHTWFMVYNFLVSAGSCMPHYLHTTSPGYYYWALDVYLQLCCSASGSLNPGFCWFMCLCVLRRSCLEWPHLVMLAEVQSQSQ